MKASPVPPMLIWLAVAAHPAVRAQEDFLRGDVNDDGEVSISDAYYTNLYLFQGVEEPRCLKSADSDDDGSVDISDSIMLLNTLFRGGPPIPRPAHEVGPDPTDDELGCDAYGGGAPIEDAGGVLEILDATTPGGEVGTASVRVRVSNSDSIGGYSGRIRSSENVLAGAGTVTNTSGVPGAGGFISAREDRGDIVFAFVPDIVGATTMPSQDGVLAMEIEMCLRGGLAAGSYPLELAEAELIDSSTGRAIRPERIGGVLSVEADVTARLECESGATPGDGGDPPRPQSPEEVDATLALDTKAVESGDSIALALDVQANTPIEGFTFSIDFDESRVRAVDATPAESDWELFVFEIDNDDTGPGDSGISEGHIAGAAVFHQTDESFFLAPDRRHEVVSLGFQALPDAGSGSSDVRFVDGGLLAGTPVSNGIRAFGQDLRAADVKRLRLRDGRLAIDPEGNEFLRGDVNADRKMSISDAVMLRRFLFLGGNEPLCHDAADSNDDGSVNIADVIVILNDLFLRDLDELSIPQPHPGPGGDPTIDTLACEVYEPSAPEESGDLIRLGDVEAVPGAPVSVPVLISSSVEVEAYQLAIAYDPELFEPAPADVTLDLEGTHYEGHEDRETPFFMIVRAIPEEGLILIGFVGSLTEEGFGVPPGEDVHVANIRGRVSEAAEPDSTIALELTNGPDGNGVGVKRLRNELTYQGDARLVTVLPAVKGALLQVVGDITFFRGDANNDKEVNVADAAYTLDYLFAGGPHPVCPDAADANDDGRIEISDPVSILGELFDTTRGRIAPPFPERGLDPTEDHLRPCGISS